MSAVCTRHLPRLSLTCFWLAQGHQKKKTSFSVLSNGKWRISDVRLFFYPNPDQGQIGICFSSSGIEWQTIIWTCENLDIYRKTECSSYPGFSIIWVTPHVILFHSQVMGPPLPSWLSLIAIMINSKINLYECFFEFKSIDWIINSFWFLQLTWGCNAVRLTGNTFNSKWLCVLKIYRG